jgi:hypothetical protein
MKADATDARSHGHSTWVKAWSSVTALMVVAALLGARSARAAETAVEAVELRYSAPAECPAEGELVAAAVEMGAGFRIAPPGELARALDVVIQRTDQGFSGTLAVRDLSGDERTRTVTCSRCESVVRALGLFVAMALVEPATVAAPSPSELPPVEPLRRDEMEPLDRSGGIAALALWTQFGWDPNGLALTAVKAVGPTRLGGLAATATESIEARGQGSTPSVASGQGRWARLGAVASWGAPWSRDEWIGLVAEAGLRASVVRGTTTALSFSEPWCANVGCPTGAGTPTTWRSWSPYVAGTFIVHLLPPRLPVRPFLGLTVLWSGDYRGDSNAGVSFDAGLAWRSW